jgi:hypothetical protein
MVEKSYAGTSSISLVVRRRECQKKLKFLRTIEDQSGFYQVNDKSGHENLSKHDKILPVYFSPPSD